MTSGAVGTTWHVTSAPAPQGEPGDGLDVRPLGERTCVLSVGVQVWETTAVGIEQIAANAAVDGYRDFVFDLTRVGRYETAALRALADLWRRLAGLGCEVYVAARNPGLVDCVERVLAARGTWSLQPTVAEALQALLARPV